MRLQLDPAGEAYGDFPDQFCRRKDTLLRYYSLSSDVTHEYGYLAMAMALESCGGHQLGIVCFHNCGQIY